MNWIDEFLKSLAADEGVRGREKSLEDSSVGTRGYGITIIPDSFARLWLGNKGLASETMSDKDLARELVLWNVEEIKKNFSNFDTWPDSVKSAMVDLRYNGGSIINYNGVTNGLRSGNWQEAMRQTLDIVGANDPETGKRGAMRGLGFRRAKRYNEVARELGFAQITKTSLNQRGEGSRIVYATDDGDISFDLSSPIHSQSGDYDDVKKKSDILDDVRKLITEAHPEFDDPAYTLEDAEFAALEDADMLTIDEGYTMPSVPEVPKWYFDETDDLLQSGIEAATGEDDQFIEGDLTMQDVKEMSQIYSENKVQTIADTFFAEGASIPDGYFEEQQQMMQEAETLQDLINQKQQLGFVRQDDDIPRLGNLFEWRNKTRYGEVYNAPDPNLFEVNAFQPDFMQTLGPAYRQFNPITALGRLIEKKSGRGPAPVEGYDIYSSPIAKKLLNPEGMRFYDNVQSDEELLLKFNRKQRDMKDMEIINTSRHGEGLSTIFSIAGPTLLAPVAPLKVMRAGAKRRFAGGFVTGYASVAGQQTAIMTQNDARNGEEAVMTMLAAGAANGAIAGIFGRNVRKQYLLQKENEKLAGEQQKIAAFGRTQARQEAIDAGLDPDNLPQSAGAAVSPEIARTRMYEQIERESLEATGVGFENLPVNPVFRLSKSPNPIAKSLSAEMVDMGGVMQKKVRMSEEAMEQSVEKEMAVRYYPKLRAANVFLDKSYARYRGDIAAEGDISLAAQSAMRGLKDFGRGFFQKPNHLTHRQFRDRVGMAMRNGDLDLVRDGATKHVNASAREYRKLFEELKIEGTKVRLFERELAKDLQAARAVGDLKRVDDIMAAIKKLRASGPAVNTAKSYLPRIYRIDKIEANPKRFIDKVSRHFIKQNRMSPKQARMLATEIMDTVTRRKPYLDLEGATDALDFVKTPTGAQARVLEVPDRILVEFLENDVEAIAKYHTKTMGIDIELTRKFGEISMEGVIREVVEEYDRLIKAAADDFDMRKSLSEAMDRDIKDIRALRDRLRGTYGAAKDPHALASRFVRTMKSINVLTSMGSAALSSVPDVARLPMVEGFQAFYKGLNVMFFESSKMAARMTKTELQEAAVAIDASLGLRAHAMSDVGDIFGNRYGIERALSDATGAMFFINGLNIWNQVLKEIAGNITILRMTASIMNKEGWNGLDDSAREKLLKNGISKQDYGIMRQQIEKHGQIEQGRWLPNTDAWTDPTQRMKFRVALNQNVDRIIITPGAGDRALWTSTEIGSLLTQFKSFGQGAFVRMLTAGMQEKDGAFWQGALMIVALAGIVNEIKRAQYGMEGDETFDQKLINAIDRSGLLGFFTDINNVTEKLTDNQIGVRPIFGEESYPTYAGAMAGAALGPTGSFAVNAGSVIGDVLSGNIDSKTADNLRFIQPGGNLIWADPILDGVYGEGSSVDRQPDANRR